jgi:hypothetical protein
VRNAVRLPSTSVEVNRHKDALSIWRPPWCFDNTVSRGWVHFCLCVIGRRLVRACERRDQQTEHGSQKTVSTNSSQYHAISPVKKFVNSWDGLPGSHAYVDPSREEIGALRESLSRHGLLLRSRRSRKVERFDAGFHGPPPRLDRRLVENEPGNPTQYHDSSRHSSLRKGPYSSRSRHTRRSKVCSDAVIVPLRNADK